MPDCDHMECPSGGPFNVVLVSRILDSYHTHAYVYSSESDIDEWSETVSVEQYGYLQRCTCNALVGNALYFLQCHNAGIMEYDLVKKELSVIELPPICHESTIIVMSVEDDGGRLGFAMVDDFSLCIWLRESAPATSSGGWPCMDPT